MSASTIFITGAASGIGLATARHFAARGWTVGLADIDEPGLASALAALGGAPHATYRLDVRDRGGWAQVMAAFGAAHGRLDCLVNNAGIARAGMLEAQSDDDVDAQIDINLKGVLNGCRAAIELLKATPGAMVVNIASVAGVVAPPRLSVYVATKWAVRGLSQSLEIEYSRFGVGVCCVMPWFLDTPLLDKAGGNQDFRGALKSAGTPIYSVEQASQAIWDAVRNRTPQVLVGAQARRTGLMARLIPGLIRKRMLREMPSELRSPPASSPRAWEPGGVRPPASGSPGLH